MSIYDKYMKKCIKLAMKADGKTSPNPLVGCVVLDKNGKVISTGYHKKCGKLHAEADALSKINDEARGGTLIVNLEPCCHYGKTPPCADLIIKKGLKRVVVGMKDPNPLVAGNGIRKCQDAGIEVIDGILESESKKLNEVFIKNMVENKVFVAIKTATTLDGKIASRSGDSKWITSAAAREEVQRIRNRYDAILTTSETIIRDNPSMTCRMKNGKNPIRIVLDRELKTDFSSKIFDNSGEKVILVVGENIENPKMTNLPPHIMLIKCPTNNCKVDLNSLLKELYKIGIRSVLVEAGGKLNGSFISEGLADKIYQFIAPKILADKNGVNAFYGRDIEKISNTVNYKFESIADFNPDILLVYSKV